MPFSSPPYQPVVAEAVNLTNPAQSAGTGQTTTAAVVIANNSPLVLSVASGEGAATAFVFPYTRDVVYLDPTAGQQITITPFDVGQVAPSTVEPVVFVTWYQAAEPIPENLPISIGNTATTTSTQMVLIDSGPAALAGVPQVIDTNPLWRTIWVVVIDWNAATDAEPVLQGETGLFYKASIPPYIAGGGQFFRFHIVTGADDFVTLTLPSTATPFGGTQYFWGADLADVDAEVYNSSGGSGMANTPSPHDFSYDAALVAGVFPGFFVSTPPGSQSFLTRLWGFLMSGTSVDVTVRVNSYPAYAGAVPVAGFDPITITGAPGGFVLPVPLEVFDLDYVDVDLSNLVAAPKQMALLVDELVVPA